MLTRSSLEWEKVLRAGGVDFKTLLRDNWGKVFAANIVDGCFSKGDAELPEFLATILHESALLTKLKEDGSYSAARIEQLAQAAKPGTRWRSLLGRADELSHNPARFFEAVYGGRLGNGPEGSGDGSRYPGRACIGITGKDNYARMAKLTGLPLVEHPELAEMPLNALRISVAWWEAGVKDADIGNDAKVRIDVNGGDIGLVPFEDLCKRMKECL